MRKRCILRTLLFCMIINTSLVIKPIEYNIDYDSVKTACQKIVDFIKSDQFKSTAKTIAGGIKKSASFLLNNVREIALFSSGVILARKITSIKEQIDWLDMPAKSKTFCKKEADKLLSSPFVSLNGGFEWFEEILSLPWGKQTRDNFDINNTKKILDEDHYGFEKIKDQILDFIALRNLKETNAQILCLVGPPGTGKTSFAQSIARSLGRKYDRISLGGVHDESELRGHRRTYIGAMPGSIIKTMKKIGFDNPVIVLDEIDKITSLSTHNGNPAAAMLEVLDPEQNKEFKDNYLEIPYDLSKVMFIATANDINTIPRPLRDRMKIIKVSGYTIEEKIKIAQQHLIKEIFKEYDINDSEVKITDEVLHKMITGYTKESGVRELKRLIKTLVAKIVRGLLENASLISKIEPDNLEKYLGPPLFIEEECNKENKVGVVNGLCWTAVGGEMLKVEAKIMPSKHEQSGGELILTGQLGNVMEESAKIALSYVRAHAKQFGIDSSLFKTHDLHIHFPAGAIPKDGSSAGITITTAIISAFSDKPVNASYAMTGEINLSGDVMPIGGVKEKILAAKRNKLSHVILPKQNAKDLTEIKDLIQDIDIILVSNIDEVIQQVLLPK